MTCHFFENADDFKKCLPVNVNTTFETLAPAIAQAETDFIKPVLGEPLFDTLSDMYNRVAPYDDTPPGPKQCDVIEHLQFAIIRLAYWDSFDQLSVMMSDNGISDQNGESRVYRYQAENLRSNLYRQGYQRLKQAMAIIEENPQEFPDFEQSPYYALSAASLIKSTQDFDSLVPIDGDFRTFSRLRRFITTVEQMDLAFRLGQELSAAIMQDQTEARFAPIMPALRMYVACKAYAEALPFLKSNAIGEVKKETSNDGTTNNFDQKAINGMTQLYNERGERYMATVINYCKNNLDTFPELAGGENAKVRTTMFRDNTHKKTVKV